VTGANSSPRSSMGTKNDDLLSCRSLVSSFVVDISHEDQGERWAFIPIGPSRRETTSDELPRRGDPALSALEAETLGEPAFELFGTSAGDTIQVALHYKGTNSDNEVRQQVNHQLIAVLSRILVQHVASRLPDKIPPEHWKIHVPSEELFQTQERTLDLFASLIDASSNTEIVEMVNGLGQRLGRVPRQFVHSLNLLHRGVGVIVTKDSSITNPSQHRLFPDFYVHRRTATKRIFPSLYDMFVGGVSGATEDSATTARREVAEELGLERALVDPTALSSRLFQCTVCTSYNRCVVDVFCFTMRTDEDQVSWQEEEVAWGEFVDYATIEASADRCMERMCDAGTWPGQYPPVYSLPTEKQLKQKAEFGTSQDWANWDYVPDGLLVWEAWLKWIAGGEARS